MKKLKVFGVPWHVGHQAELACLPFIDHYDLVYNPYRKWGTTHRPFPKKCRWVTHFKKNYYDFAILHVDQQSIYNLEQGDRIHKGKLYMELKETIGDDCPIVTINHMTPFHDKYDGPYVVDFIKKMTKGTLMITNSRTAAKQWGWGTPVIHGMDVDEWWDLPKEPRVTTVLSPAGMEKAYRRVFLREVIKKLKEAEVPFVWIGVDRKFNSFDEYRNFLGRSLIFFFPAWQSPMSRARTEAMLSGACIVTTPYQDADTFIEHGVNGFLTSKYTMKDPRIMDNPDATAKLIKRLVLDEPELAIKVGQEGRKTARKLFCRENFTKQWIEIVKKLGIEGM
jgi:hypothetical protein